MKKSNFVKFLSSMFVLLNLGQAKADNPWFECGVIGLGWEKGLFSPNRAELLGFSPTRYEYGVAYNSVEPMPIIVTTWNRGAGIRIYNKQPYFVYSDTPVNKLMRFGGFMFHTGSDANCPSHQLRHNYWTFTDYGTIKGVTIVKSGAGSVADMYEDSSVYIKAADSNGCYGSDAIQQVVFCRAR